MLKPIGPLLARIADAAIEQRDAALDIAPNRRYIAPLPCGAQGDSTQQGWSDAGARNTRALALTSASRG